MPDTDNHTPLTAIVVGARTQRQGTGPFIAAGLDMAGVSVSGIVGTSEESVTQAQQQLARNWQIHPQGFIGLPEAIRELQPDAVAICSPWQVHAGQLEQVARARCHCLVEKPLAWPMDEDGAKQLISAFAQENLLLQVVNQWPTTLTAFAELHGGIPGTIENFTMRLSPISIGPDMVTDSAPHFIGMLQALGGPGDCLETHIETIAKDELRLHCQYQHTSGTIEATLILKTQQQRPRPAWYQLNDLRADRVVELPDYQQYLAAGERRVALADPIHQVTSEFTRAVAAAETTNSQGLLAAHRNLLQLAAAWY